MAPSFNELARIHKKERCLCRKLMNMTLSVDHKVANGAYAAQFLDFTRKLLEEASTLP